MFKKNIPAYYMNWRSSHDGLVRYACARDRNHNRSSGEGSMCMHNVPEPVRICQFM